MPTMKRTSIHIALFAVVLLSGCAIAQREQREAIAPAVGPAVAPAAAVATARDGGPESAIAFAAAYSKREVMIPMRDGVRLFTQVFVPRDVVAGAGAGKTYPILMNRTPYSVGPYGDGQYPENSGSLASFVKDGFIIVRQDVRGRNKSEGTFVNMTPHRAIKAGAADIDESSDTYDTVDWLIKNVPGNNGRVGQWGVSYPGFYCSAGMIGAHPALKAVSPQAPIADWWFDDFYHRGCFFTPHYFGFFYGFGAKKPAPGEEPRKPLEYGTKDGYKFFLELGPLANIDKRFYQGSVPFWFDVASHPNYDDFWQARNILPHLKRVAPAVMVVGGWYDAEDLYGALNTYQSIEKQNPGSYNVLVMGPWGHGDWSRREGSSLGDISFGQPTSSFYQETVELPFFKAALKEGRTPTNPEAFVYETGENRWRNFDAWPPKNVQERTFYLGANGALSSSAGAGTAFDEFVSDPAKPVPYTERVSTGMVREYMTEDQRFASRRPDVLTYRTPPLEGDLTIAGPLTAELFVSTTGTDADWVVKLIDEYPGDAIDPATMNPMRTMSSYQMMVRSESMRGRYRESFSVPKAFVPGEVTPVSFPLQDVLHTFKKGHRVMVQVQSTWFPLMDRNPQTFVPNIFEATESDFVKATHRVYLGQTGQGKGQGSRLRFSELPALDTR